MNEHFEDQNQKKYLEIQSRIEYMYKDPDFPYWPESDKSQYRKVHIRVAKKLYEEIQESSFSNQHKNDLIIKILDCLEDMGCESIDEGDLKIQF